MSNYYNSGYGNAGGSRNSYYGGGCSQTTNYATDQQAQVADNEWKQQQSQQQASAQTTKQEQLPSFCIYPSTVGEFAAMAANSVATGGYNSNPSTVGAFTAMAENSIGGDNPTAVFHQLIKPQAQTFLKTSTARMVPGLESVMTTLRRYFQVDNRYVKRKLQRIFFPFRCKSWQRVKLCDAPSQGRGMSDVAYAMPHSDENAPDLYIPIMSLITYVLLCALVYGNAGQFNPEVLSAVASLCCMTQLVEVLVIRFGYSMMMQAPVAFLDLFSYTGYKYFGLSSNMLAAILATYFGLGKKTYYIFFLYTASAASFFMWKTLMANNIPVNNIPVATTVPKREIMVLGFALSQCLTMYIVSKTKFLS